MKKKIIKWYNISLQFQHEIWLTFERNFPIFHVKISPFFLFGVEKKSGLRRGDILPLQKK